ncbi:hypothetical protein D3C72_1768680 [compost metagenome]
MDQAGLAGVGQLHPGGVAVQQRGAQGGLQVGDPLAGRPHRQMRLARAGRDAALARNGNKQGECDEVDTGKVHGKIRRGVCQGGPRAECYSRGARAIIMSEFFLCSWMGEKRATR